MFPSLLPTLGNMTKHQDRKQCSPNNDSRRFEQIRERHVCKNPTQLTVVLWLVGQTPGHSIAFSLMSKTCEDNG